MAWSASCLRAIPSSAIRFSRPRRIESSASRLSASSPARNASSSAASERARSAKAVPLASASAACRSRTAPIAAIELGQARQRELVTARKAAAPTDVGAAVEIEPDPRGDRDESRPQALQLVRIAFRGNVDGYTHHAPHGSAQGAQRRSRSLGFVLQRRRRFAPHGEVPRARCAVARPLRRAAGAHQLDREGVRIDRQRERGVSREHDADELRAELRLETLERHRLTVVLRERGEQAPQHGFVVLLARGRQLPQQPFHVRLERGSGRVSDLFRDVVERQAAVQQLKGNAPRFIEVVVARCQHWDGGAPSMPACASRPRGR